MENTIHLPATGIPVLAQADVVVCGGGCAGITAAVSAARHGASVVLLERWPTVGGMATNALVNGWHRSDREKVVINGLVEESARRAASDGWLFEMPNYPLSHETHWFDPEGMRIVWQRMLREAGVRVLCYLVAGDPVIADGTMSAVLVDTKDGRRAVAGDLFIDATGDGDIGAKAGLPFEYGREDGLVQGMTQMFELQGVDWLVARRAGKPAIDEVVDGMRQARDSGQLPPFNEGNTAASLNLGFGDRHGFFYWNMAPVAGNPLCETELTELTMEARERIVSYVNYWRKHMPGFQNARISQTGFAMGVRESRRIRGRKTLSADDVLGAKKEPDAIGHGVWMIDIHDPKGSGYTTFSDRNARTMLKEGESYHIPLGMCLNEHIPNLAVVGRCASTTHEALSSVRVQTHCMVMGQGVGTCAALALDGDCTMSEVDVGALQTRLLDDGVYLEDVSYR